MTTPTEAPPLTLVEFLRARIDEDETAALDCVDQTWEQGEIHAENVYGSHERLSLAADYRYAAHIARHDPARVLAEAAAKRAIIEETLAEETWSETCVLAYLAAVYAAHPDYDEAWRP